MVDGSSFRGYFSFRWAIPGYTFILIVAGINYVAILETLVKPEAVGVLLGFLALLSGSALGFLVTQPYWLWVNKGQIFRFACVEQIEKILDKSLDKSFELTLPKSKKQKERTLGAILDFAFYMKQKRGEVEVARNPFLEYVWRRWDMIHLSLSTRSSLLIGLSIGLAYRICRQLVIVPAPPINTSEVLVLVFLIIFAVALSIVLCLNAKDVWANYQPTFEAVVRDRIGIDPKRLVTAFPDYLSEKEQKPKKPEIK